MRFTKYHTLQDILNYPKMQEYLHLFYSDYLMGMFPENKKQEPLALAEFFGETPWEDPFSVIVDQLLDAANLVLDMNENQKRNCIGLWEDDQKWTLEKEAKGGKHQVLLLAPAKKQMEEQDKYQKKYTGTNPKKNRPAVIICPGGGYENVCFSGEGTPVMNYMEAQGYRAFILKYQVAPARYPEPQKDLVYAVCYLRKHAKEYGIDENDILILGASAGGHLCASVPPLHSYIEPLVRADLEKMCRGLGESYAKISGKPDKVSLSYPVISFQKEQHEGSFQNLTGGMEKMRKTLSVEEMVMEDYPKTFVWACADDDCVPASNAIRMGEVLKQKQVEHELHIYPTGGHGCGLAFGKSASGWSREMITYMK